MAVYMIAQINIHDRARYAQYGDGFVEIFRQYQGKILAVEEDQEVLEGDWDYTRTVLIEFPTKQAAKQWYQSDAYQALAQHRFAASDANLALINGWE